MTLPQSWNTSEVLDGLALIDKEKLVDVPFRINGVEFVPNHNGDINYCRLDIETAEGDTYTFQDASSGVRMQIISYLTGKEADHIVDSGEYYQMNLVVPRGLRVSEYDRPVRNGMVGAARGRSTTAEKARTYYLTTSGRRAARTENTTTSDKPAPKRTPRASSSS